MKKKWLLVLGAGSDIALATAHQFASKGWNILLCSRNIDSLSKSAADLQIRYQIEAVSLYFDAEDFVSHSEFYKNIPVAPDGVLLAFGHLGDQHIAQSDFVLSKQIIDVNYLGAVSILEIIAASFEKSGGGFIVGISSVAGDRGRASNYIYGSSKAALTVYLSGLRHRMFAHNVNVITVKPGFVATKMTENLDLPKLLTATPELVGKAIYNGVFKNKNIIYVKSIWRWIMLIISLLPDFIFKRTKL